MYRVICLNKCGEEVGVLGDMESKEEAEKAAAQFNKDLNGPHKGCTTIITRENEDATEAFKDETRAVKKAVVISVEES